MIQQNTVMARMVYENAKQIIAEAGISLATAVLTQSTLRLEQQFKVGLTQYQFPVLVNNNGPSNTLFNTEIRLNQQDAFVVSAWGFYQAKPSSGVDTTFILHTYPSPVTFSTSGVAAAMETLYNSTFQIAVNNQIIVPVVSTYKFRYVPQSQQVAAATNQNGIAQDQIDLSIDGKVAIEPNILIVGSKNTVINLIMPAALAVVETFQRGAIIFDGVLAQNSTIIT